MTFDDDTHVDLNDPEDVIAHHEAGHAVMSWILRSFVGAVTIEPDARHLGGTEVWVLAPPLVDEAGKIVEKDQYTAEELACFEDATMIAQAGPVAETIYWSNRTYDEVLMKNESDEASIVTITQKIWRENARDVEMELCDRVRGVLEKEWAAVARLAEALEKNRTVDGPAVVSVIGLD